MQETYAISGMHCQGCAGKIEAALRPYGERVAVDLPSATLHIVGATATLDELNRHVAGVGAYSIMPLPAVEADRPAIPVATGAALSPGERGYARYYPLLLILAYLSVGSFAGAADAAGWMRHFMAGFFLVFSFFKLLNLNAFAASYAMYDLIAARWKGYGMIYPFLELALGLAYLFAFAPQVTLWATLALTVVSGVGVVRSMTRGQAIRCACLGAVLDVPVSTVTLIEDFGMAAMAVLMLVQYT